MNMAFPFRQATVQIRQQEHVMLWRLFVNLAGQLDIETQQGPRGLQGGKCGSVYDYESVSVSMACS